MALLSMLRLRFLLPRLTTLTDGTSIYVDAQIPTTEVNYLGEGATAIGAGGDGLVTSLVTHSSISVATGR